MKNKSPYINGDGTQTRDFTFVENAVQANIKAAFAEHPDAIGKIYNVAVGDTTSINDIFNELKNLTGSAAYAEYRDERQGDIRDSLADITSAKTYLGYAPQIKLNEGLKLTFEWFKNMQLTNQSS